MAKPLHDEVEELLAFLDQARNEDAARVELTQQGRSYALIRPIADLIKTQFFRGADDAVDNFDVMAAIMWFFDVMVYLEGRQARPGMTRREALEVLVRHLKEAYPEWEGKLTHTVANKVFDGLTPRDGFRSAYYDFAERSHRPVFFRLMEWKETADNELLYRLTPHGLVLYSTRLQEQGLDLATVAAMKAERMIRRGEIKRAMDQADQARRQLEQFERRLDATVRAIRTGDTSFSFAERMVPLLDDAGEVLGTIVNHLQQAVQSIADRRQETEVSKRGELHAAETRFYEFLHFSARFRRKIPGMHEQVISSRSELIGHEQQTGTLIDFKPGIFIPLLESSVEGHDIIAELVSAALPPLVPVRNVLDDHVLLDLKRILDIYDDHLEPLAGEGPDEGQPDDEEDYTEPEPMISEADIALGTRWVTDRLSTDRRVSFQDVLSAFRGGMISDSVRHACLAKIGEMATTDKEKYNHTVTIDGLVDDPKWDGDNLGIDLTGVSS